MPQLTTDWIRVATEGETFRNVPIQRQWIIDIAETYDPKTYGARIWPDHRRWYGAWGDVTEVKAEEHESKMVLFAKLTPNQYLIQANKEDQKVYSSIELEPNFAGSGKAYLTGLGVTDEPASLGTDRLKFSADSQHIYSAPQPLEITFPLTSKDADQGAKLFGLLKGFFNTSEKTPKEDEPMDEKQFNALVGKIDGIASKVGELETKVETFGKKDEVTPPKGDVQPPKTEGETEVAITAEQFSKLTETIAGMLTKVDGLDAKFSKLTNEIDDQEPNPAGKGDNMYLV